MLTEEVVAQPNANPLIFAHTIVKYFNSLTEHEKKRFKADKLAIFFMLQWVPNDIYNIIDSHNSTGKELWDQIEKQMMGTSVGHFIIVKYSFGNAQNLKLVTSLREENECLKKTVFELNEEKTVFENKFLSSQSRIMDLLKQVSDFEQTVIIERSNFQNQKDEYERQILELEKKVSNSKVIQTDSQQSSIENKKAEKMKKDLDTKRILIEKERKVFELERKSLN